MKKSFIVVLALLGIMIVNVSTAQAFGGWRRRGQVTYAPAPSAVVAQGQADNGYRTYSYQPDTGYRANSYQPGMSYNRAASQPGSGFHDAGWKARGGF